MAEADESSPVRRDVMVTPFDDRRGPGVMIVHSGRGLTDYVRQVCTRIAHRGFVGYAVDLFDGETPTTVADAQGAKAALDDERALARLEDGTAFLREFRGVSRDTVGVVGIGYGGELAVRLAERDPDPLGAVVSYYGYHDVDWGNLAVPFLGHFAERDPEISMKTLRAADERLREGGRHGSFKVYAGTEPSFFEDEPTARYDSEAARKSWDRTVEFLQWALYR